MTGEDMILIWNDKDFENFLGKYQDGVVLRIGEWRKRECREGFATGVCLDVRRKKVGDYERIIYSNSSLKREIREFLKYICK